MSPAGASDIPAASGDAGQTGAQALDGGAGQTTQCSAGCHSEIEVVLSKDEVML